MPSLGVPELVIILVIVLILFGAGKMADIGGALGKGIREFRKASNEAEKVTKEVEEGLKEATGKEETESDKAE